jgi:hypothetical protein
MVEETTKGRDVWEMLLKKHTLASRVSIKEYGVLPPNCHAHRRTAGGPFDHAVCLVNGDFFDMQTEHLQIKNC